MRCGAVPLRVLQSIVEDFIAEVGPPPPPAVTENNGEESVDDKGDQGRGNDEAGEKQESNESSGDGGDS